MDGSDFRKVIEGNYAPALITYGFSISKVSIHGRAYTATFLDTNHCIIVSFEPGDNYLFALVGPASAASSLTVLDDASVTLRLPDLMKQYGSLITIKDRFEVTQRFNHLVTNDPELKQLLRTGANLTLVLPYYLASPNP